MFVFEIHQNEEPKFRNILGIGGMKNSEIYIVSGGIVRYGNG